MDILIIGTSTHLEEVRQKFGDSHRYRLTENHSEVKWPDAGDVIFDFIIDNDPSQISVYRNPMPAAIFLNTTTTSLTSLKASSLANIVFGFCGMPTFLHREILEVSASAEHRAELIAICRRLDTRFEVVADGVGFVTPRVICMIINEAYYTAEEDTATRDDIERAMKLGTNYPFGPFEWGARIGIKNVCRLLEAVHRDTGDERYQVCPLLKREASQ